jgi:CheY-like chemotaxis protein
VIRAVVVSPRDLAPELGETVLFRRNVERVQATGLEEARRLSEESRPDVLVVDSSLPGAAALVAALRQDPLTRQTAIVVLGRTEFGFDHLELLEAGANTILPLPPDHDWDDRLMRLIHVPARKATRIPVDIRVEGGLRGGLAFGGRALNLSVHGLLLECRQTLDVGDDLVFSLEVPGGHGLVQGSGTVVRMASAHHFGVELTHVEGDGRVRIKRFVESGGPA